MEPQRINEIWKHIQNDFRRSRVHFEDLSNEAVFSQHASLLITIANSIVLEPQRRKFVIDERNKELLRFLLYYFNDCQLAEQVF
ncbi:hypothetical protein QP561_10605, partial [Veillonella nakazawae]|nr:hypothetical protein [Veillonella nakazawae]